MSKARLRQGATLALLLFFVVSLLAQDRAREILQEVVLWVRQLGWSGALVYGGMYVVATVALVPGAVLTLGSGFLYGPVWGALLVFVCSLAGASLAFALARNWWRPWVLGKLQSRPTLLALDERLAEDGWKIVFLLRLSPLVPFSFLNYALGATRLPFRDYFSASALGMLPAIVLYTYIGSALASFGKPRSSEGSLGDADSIPFWVGLAATFLVSVVLTRWARRALRELEVGPTPAES